MSFNPNDCYSSKSQTIRPSSKQSSDHKITPEVLFLIKEQAKAIAKINALQKKVDQLEHKVNNESKCIISENCVQSLRQTSTASSSTTKSVNTMSDNNSKDKNAISDDSGGEYSRATTTTSDEDELSSLLDRITVFSQQIHNNGQQNKLINKSDISRNSNTRSNRLVSQSMQMRQKLMHSLSNPTVRTNTIDTNEDKNRFGECHQSNQQSISALLFEPNVESLLKNIDDLITTPTNNNNTSDICSNTSYQRRDTLGRHSSPSLYQTIGITGIGQSSTPVNNINSNSSSNWHLERVKSVIKQKEELEFETQMRLNEEWLQTQLKAVPNQQRIRLTDSLEPAFR